MSHDSKKNSLIDHLLDIILTLWNLPRYLFVIFRANPQFARAQMR
jgi:hypothetical protein